MQWLFEVTAFLVEIGVEEAASFLQQERWASLFNEAAPALYVRLHLGRYPDVIE